MCRFCCLNPSKEKHSNVTDLKKDHIAQQKAAVGSFIMHVFTQGRDVTDVP